jgi:unsaturated rhamnogalacturonyl hydrolase
MRHRQKTALLVSGLLLKGSLPCFSADLPQREDVVHLGRKVADWQLRQLGHLPGVDPLPEPRAGTRSWQIAAFWIGLTRFADSTEEPSYREALLAQGKTNDWQLGPSLHNADDHAIGQSYLWAAENGAGVEALAPMQTSFSKILASPPRVHLSFYFGKAGYGSAECLVRWCWCDALFMSPPAMIGLSLATGDDGYAEYALSEFWATTDFLFDPVERLYFRDSRFFTSRDDQGRKLFWSRGNGWVFAGIANILDMLPNGHPERPRLEALFKDMAGRLVQLQKEDGFWPPSLLAPEEAPPETSGTAFFTYGLAWGVNRGLLEREEFVAAAAKGWQALEGSVDASGRLGWVQQVSDRPDMVGPDDTHYYGVGAFLLAASEVARLSATPPNALPGLQDAR